MHDIRVYIEKIEEIAVRVPFSHPEIANALGIKAQRWWQIRKSEGKETQCKPSTIRAMKAFIEKYKDVM